VDFELHYLEKKIIVGRANYFMTRMHHNAEPSRLAGLQRRRADLLKRQKIRLDSAHRFGISQLAALRRQRATLERTERRAEARAGQMAADVRAAAAQIDLALSADGAATIALASEQAKLGAVVTKMMPQWREQRTRWDEGQALRLQEEREEVDRQRKARHRAFREQQRRAALLALRPAKLFSAREAYELALQRRPADRFFAKQLRSTTERLHAEAWRGPAPGVRPRAAGCLIESVAHMELVFKNIDHQHVRLAALGLFWNRARPHERLLLFKRFMTELSDTPVALQLSAQMMRALPLVPMQIALIPPEWLLFYEPLHLKAKVTLCMHLWRLCSSFEQAAIIKDLRALFGQ
jgi:hypothetical protein